MWGCHRWPVSQFRPGNGGRGNLQHFAMEFLPLDREDTTGLIALFRLVWNAKALVLGLTALCAGLAVIYALVATPTYRADVGITEVTTNGIGGVNGLASQLGGLAGLVGVNLGQGGGPGHESMAILKSRWVIEQFVRRHSMAELFPDSKEVPPTLWRAVRRFQLGVFSIREDKRAGITIVSVTFTDPAVAARWANEFVALVNETVRARAIDEAKRSIGYLTEQASKTHDVELQHVIYNLIENETKTLTLANVKAEYAFTVVDPAVPPELRVSPQRTIIVVGGALVGFLLAVALAYARTIFRSGKRSVAENS
jgi:uncharacterized protein involved in exopolysaccharide biosynthesis